MSFWARLSTSYCIPFWQSSFCMWVSTKSFIGLDLRPRIVACKKKLMLAKPFHIKNNLKNKCIKDNFTISFACEKNGMDMPVCVIIKPWISFFLFSALDCDRDVPWMIQKSATMNLTKMYEGWVWLCCLSFGV
jgi:hypothetical protein